MCEREIEYLYLGNSSESESESENENCRTLTDIASGYTLATITGDFFGDAELAGQFTF